MMEMDMLQWAMNNGVGVVFALLMFYMCNTAIRKNTQAIEILTQYIKLRK